MRLLGGGARQPANRPEWGSDLLADALRATGIPYVCFNPGSSFRGLHDSLVNYLGDEQPRHLMVLHEEHAVAIAHGYALVTGKPLAAVVHANVGLLHASMAVFNAWCGRVPLLLLGGTGPLDATKRRPWIDWIHTTADEGAVVRDFTKWDDRPGSPKAGVDSIARAHQLTATAPMAPVFVSLDTQIQETPIGDASPDRRPRAAPIDPPPPAADELDRIAAFVESSESPVILAGRVAKSEPAWADRVRFAEMLGARVITSVGAGSGFPTGHALHAGESHAAFAGRARDAIENSDLIISLDWIDLGGALRTVWPELAGVPPVIAVTLDHQLAKGWSKDDYGLFPADVRLSTTPEAAVSAMTATLGGVSPAQWPAQTGRRAADLSSHAELDQPGAISLGDLAFALNGLAPAPRISLLSRAIRWIPDISEFDHPLAYLGDNGGGGLGAGPGMAVGSALALRDHYPDVVPVAVLGDGDMAMGGNALWSAAKENIPLLVVVADNRSFFADEVLQHGVAETRNRDPDRRTIGTEIDGPPVEMAGLAQAFGFDYRGAVDDRRDLVSALTAAIGDTAAGGRIILDVAVSRDMTALFPERGG